MNQIKNYQLIEKIGEGAFGETYLACRGNQPHSKRVIVKRLRVNQLDHWKAVERFNREAKLMKQLNHPGIPKYIDFIEEEQFTGIVQEYIEGRTLEQLIRAERLSPSLIESILKQGLEILHYLESLSPPIIHRDISPKNMILDQFNHLHLIDFGSVQKSYSDTITCMGTFGYMAPEQLKGRATHQSDLFSFGMVILTLIAGSPINSLSVNPETGSVDVDKLLQNQSEVVQKIVPLLLKPGVKKRLKTAKRGLRYLSEIKRVDQVIQTEIYPLNKKLLRVKWTSLQRRTESLVSIMQFITFLLYFCLYMALSFSFENPIVLICVVFLPLFLLYNDFLLEAKYSYYWIDNCLSFTPESCWLQIDGETVQTWEETVPEIKLKYENEMEMVNVYLVFWDRSFPVRTVENWKDAEVFKDQLTSHLKKICNTNSH